MSNLTQKHSWLGLEKTRQNLIYISKTAQIKVAQKCFSLSVKSRKKTELYFELY